MSEYHYLIGSDEVFRAGHNMLLASESFTSAVSNMDESLRNHQRFLDDWLMRFESTLEQFSKKENA